MAGVLFVSHSSELNGAELWLLETLRGLDRRAFDARLAVPRPGPLPVAAGAAGIPVAVVPFKWDLTGPWGVWKQPLARALNRRAAAELARLVAAESIALVVSNSAATFVGARAARLAGVPHVWSVHEVLGGRRPLLRYIGGSRALARRILAGSARVIVNSEATRASFPESRKVVIVPNGFAVRETEAEPEKTAALRERLGLRAGDRVVGGVGRICPAKGQLEIVRAAGLACRDHPSIRVLLVGDVKSERYARRLRAARTCDGAEPLAVFAGHQADLGPALRLMDVLVVASKIESFGRAAVEGMAAGVPVLAVRTGGLPEIVEDGCNGFLAASRRPEDLAAALARILSDAEAARRAVAGGYRTVRERYSLERQVRGVERALAEALAPAGRKSGRA